MSGGARRNWEGRGFWTDEMVERLRKLVATGASFSEIGRTLKCSRNAAIAKAHRSGIKQPTHAAKPGFRMRGGGYSKPGGSPRGVPKSRGAWTDERVAELRRMWADGVSGKGIGLALGGLCEATVYKKVQRLGLQRPIAAPKAPKPRVAPKRAPAPVLAVTSTGQVFARQSQESPLTPVPANVWAPLPGVEPVSILDLKPTHCRWPLELQGEDFPHFCGAMAIGGAYCPSHARKARPSAATKAWVEKRVAHGLGKAVAA